MILSNWKLEIVGEGYWVRR